MSFDPRFPSRFLVATFLLTGLCLGCSSSDSQVGQGTASTPAPENTVAAPAFAPRIAPQSPGIAARPTPSATAAATPSGSVPSAAPAMATAASNVGPAVDHGEQAPDALTLQPAKLYFAHPKFGEAEQNLDVTSDGDVALEGELFVGASADFLLSLPKYPFTAGVEWTDYRDGSVRRRRAVVESPGRVYLVAGEAPPRAAPPPSTVAGSPAANGNTAANPPAPAPAGSPVDATLELPGEVDDVAAGGSGRYLVLAIPSKRQVALVDLREKKIARTIDAGTDDFLIAAGATRFVVLNRTSKTLSRYRFDAEAAEQTAPVPGTRRSLALAMNAFGEGPLWLVEELTQAETESRTTKPKPPVRALDLDRLAQVGGVAVWPEGTQFPHPRIMMLRSISGSAAGDRCCIPTANDAPLMLRLVGDKILPDKVPTGADAPKGHTVNLTPGGLLLRQGTAYPDGSAQTVDTSAGFTVPYGGADAWFAVDWGSSGSGGAARRPLAIRFHPDGKGPVAAELQLAELAAAASEIEFRRPEAAPTLLRRLHFSAGDKVFAFVARNPDRVLLKAFDPASAEHRPAEPTPVAMPAASSPTGTSAAAPVPPPPVAVAASTAPIRFARGRRLEHRIEPAAPAGAKLELLSGPPDMKVSQAGVIEWPASASAADRYTAILGIEVAGEPRGYRVVRLEAESAVAPPAGDPVKPRLPQAEQPLGPDAFGAKPPKPKIDAIVAYRMIAPVASDAAGGTVRPIPSGRQIYAPPGATGYVDFGPGNAARHVFVVGEGRRIAAVESRRAIRIVKADPAAGGSSLILVGPRDPGDVVVPLPGPATDVVPAGDGRYLLLAFGSLRHVAVFDVRTATIVRFADAGSEDFFVAGGKTRFVVYDRTNRKFRRGDLAGGVLDKEAVLPQRFGKVDALAMGIGSEGPAYFLAEVGDAERACNLKKLDVETLTGGDITTSDKVRGGADFDDLSVSADGRRVGWGKPHDIVQIVEVEGAEAKLIGTFGGLPGSVVINRTGDAFFSGPQKRFVPEGAIWGGSGRGMLSGDGLEGSFWYTASFRPDQPTGAGIPVQFYAGAEPQALAQTSAGLYGTADVAWKPGWNTPSIRRPLHYSTAEKTLAVVGLSPPRLVVKRFDVRTAVKESGFDVLTVASTPPETFPKQPNLTYQIETISSRGAPTYRLESGPADMTISPEGLVSWKGPTEGASFRRAVIVVVGDPSGRTTRHAFQVPSSSFEAVRTAAASATPAPSATPGATTPASAPASAPAEHVLQLPDAPPAVEGAGDGRYLLTAFPQLRKVGVIDLRDGGLRLVDVGSSRFLIAGGLTRFVVVDQEKKKLLRYRIDNGELEKEAPYIAGPAGIVAATMGVGSEGPMFLWYGGDPASGESLLRVVDLESPAVRPVDVVERKSVHLFQKADQVKEVYRLSTAADGSRLVIVHHGGQNNGPIRWSMFGYRDGRAVVFAAGNGDKQSRAAYDGGTVFGYAFRNTLCRTEVNFNGEFYPVRSCFSDNTWLSYARSGNHSLHVRLHRGLDKKVLGTVTLDVTCDEGQGPRLAETSFYSAAEKTLAVVQSNPERVSLFRIDADAVIGAAKTPYIAFNSSPQMLFVPGAKYTYAVRAVSDAPEISFRLQKGPKEMTISPTGLLEWKSPAAPPGKKVNTQETVVVAAASTAGEVLQEFTIRADPAATILNKLESKPSSATAAGATSAGATPVATTPAPPAKAEPMPTGTSGGTAAAPELRKWTSSDGKFTVTATLVELKGDAVVLKQADGRTIEVPLERLSPEDQAFARAAGKKP